MTNIIRTTNTGPRAKQIATAIAMLAIADVQRRGGVCAYIDTLAAFDVAGSQVAGVALRDLLISQPGTLGQAQEIVETLARTGAIDLIIVDADIALPSASLTATILVIS